MRVSLCLISMLFFIGSPSYAKSKKTAHSKKHQAKKRSKRKVPKGLVFNPQLEKVAIGKVARADQQISSSKTLGDWVNKGNKQVRLSRRMHFSKNLNQPMPTVIRDGFSLLILSKGSKKSSSFTLFPDKTGLKMIVDGLDITPRKREKFKTWKKRIAQLFDQSKTAWLDLLMPKAHAYMDGQFLGPITVIAHLTNDAWEKADPMNVAPGAFTPGFAEKALLFRDEYGLSCDPSNGQAKFKAKFFGTEKFISVAPRIDNTEGDMKRVSFSISDKPNDQFPGNRVTFSPTGVGVQTSGDGSGAKVLAGQFAPNGFRRIWNNQNLQPKPQYQQEVFVKEREIGEGYQAFKMCQTLVDGGVNTKACKNENTPFEYRACFNKILKSQLKKRGMGFNKAPMSGIDRKDAIALKVKLLSIMHERGVQFGRTIPYPGQNDARTFRGSHSLTAYNAALPGYNNLGQAESSVGMDSRDDEHYHHNVTACAYAAIEENLLSSKDCDLDAIKRDFGATRGSAILKDLQAIYYRKKVGPTRVNDLAKTIDAEISSAAPQCRKFMPPKLVEGMKSHADYDRMTPGSREKLEEEHYALSNAGYIASVSQIFCGNEAFRALVNGTKSIDDFKHGKTMGVGQ